MESKRSININLLPEGDIISILVFASRVLAVLVSWYYNSSILWAIFHFIIGPFYIIYSLLMGRFVDGNITTIINSYI
jgi:hypothetical protein